ncbi:efflux RND transporter periplasmic adaptor subunit [Paludisphaera rhizosphaerae]|uniref:efflux RND transporter periplasmic adaptor subunit n=1 Tax=Paludisphaera rhizosphaerae TaxID=2711216 RepID=UPI00197E128A|nr:efflux RND transporter periplasmic adaptor subunit [Paludisphaera rhizosphaerae]
MSNAVRSVETKEKPPISTRSGGWFRRITALVAIGLVGLAVAWWGLVGRRAEARKTIADSNAETKSAEPITVRVVRPSPGGIRRTSAQIGSVQPFQEADLFAKVSGYLSKLYVDYGDHVKAGQILAEIDDPEDVEEANRTAADVAQAEAVVVQAQALVDSAQADRSAFATAVEQAEAEVERYASMRNYHEKKYARYRDLVARQAIPQQIADEEEEGYESAMASETASRKAVLNAKAQLEAAVARVKKAEADVVVARAAVQVARAKHARAQTFVAYMKISSPYDGVVTRRNYFPGAFIRSAAEGGTIPLLTVARIDKVRVVTQIPDRDVPYADVGDEADVTLDAIPGRVFKGAVSRFANSEDPTSRTMYTEIDLPNPDLELRPGMYGVATVILDQSTKTFTIPASALVGESHGGKGDVFAIKDGVAKKTRVEIGADDGLRIEILSGITSDDQVILDVGSVADGTPVQPAPEQSRPAKETPKPVHHE